MKESSLPRAGLGLFARRRFPAGAVLCEYTGRELRTVEALRQFVKFVFHRARIDDATVLN